MLLEYITEWINEHPLLIEYVLNPCLGVLYSEAWDCLLHTEAGEYSSATTGYRPTNGIFHICGDECMSIAEIAYQVADYMGLDHSFIHPVTTEEMNETTPRPRFSGMSIDKARTMLGYEPQKLKEVLANWEHL